MSAPPSIPELSIVVPAYNEEACVDALADLLPQAIGGATARWELILVDDGSQDATVSRWRARMAADHHLRLVKLARNFGKEAALVAGLAAARGRAVIPLDADLQDPPELIPRMLDLWRRGHAVVVALKGRRDEAWFKRVSAQIFYRILRLLGARAIEGQVGEFRLMDRQVVDDFLRLRETDRWNKGLMAWVSRQEATVVFDRPPRHDGHVKFTLGPMIAHALDGITSSTVVPLRLCTLLAVAGLTLMWGYWLLTMIRIFVLGYPAALGYPSLLSAIIGMGCLNLLGLGVVGEYVGRSYLEGKRRPLYLLESCEGFPDARAPRPAATRASLPRSLGRRGPGPLVRRRRQLPGRHGARKPLHPPSAR